MNDSSTAAIYSALGELAVNWNFAESWIRTLAGSYLGQGKQAIGEIFTVELGSVGLQNVLCSIARHCPVAGESGSLENCAEFYERLREYRNYYIHGTILATEYGFTFTKSAKGQIRTYTARVEASQIQAIAAQCRELGLHARQIYCHLYGDSQDGGAKPPLPDKPLLPPRLDKSAPYPQLQNSQPPA